MSVARPDSTARTARYREPIRIPLEESDADRDFAALLAASVVPTYRTTHRAHPDTRRDNRRAWGRR